MTLIGYRGRNHPQQTSKRGARDIVDDRRTPPDLLGECAEQTNVTAFDLDVAATVDNTKAPAFYDLGDDGLACAWWGRVWCNPPYSDCGAWVHKAHQKFQHCDVIAMLLPANRTEQRWWQNHVELWRIDGPRRIEGRIAVHFLAGRRRFDRPGWTKPAKGDRPPFGLCLLVWDGAENWTAHR